MDHGLDNSDKIFSKSNWSDWYQPFPDLHIVLIQGQGGASLTLQLAQFNIIPAGVYIGLYWLHMRLSYSTIYCETRFQRWNRNWKIDILEEIRET